MFRFGVNLPKRALTGPLGAHKVVPFASRHNVLSSLSIPIGVRFNSSSSVSEIKNKLTDFTAESAAAISENTSSILKSDELGYMSSIGLADGWGPTSLITHILEITHVYTGLPWWATIATATVLVRLAMFPIYVKSSANMAKMSKIKPQVDELMAEMRNGDSAEKMAAVNKRNRLYKENGIKVSHSFLPLSQLPIAYGFFSATRAMAHYPVEGLTTQGTLWFEDLTQVDPYLGLQILTALVVTGMVRSGGETGAQAMNPVVKKVMTYLPFASIFVTYNMSASILVYFVANAVFSFAQSLLLRNKHFRKLVSIPPIQTPVRPPGAKAPPQTISEWWTEYNANLKKQARSKMEQTNKKLENIDMRKTYGNDNFIKRH